LSQYQLPVVLAADQLGIFELLDASPADLSEISSRTQLPRRSVEALMAALSALGFAVQRLGQFHLTEVARTYLVKDGHFYWLPMLRGVGSGQAASEALVQLLHTDNLGHDARISRRWERGELTPEDAQAGNRRMHSHSLPAALGLARNGDFSGVRRLLDMAGGSGCFSIALVDRNPMLACTVADLPAVVADTRTYIARSGCQDRVDTCALNMFEDAWPTGYDAILFSNVLHDWDPRRCDELLQRSLAALPPAGRIYLHEILLNDTHDGPLEAALFSVMMLGTRGKQFSAVELETMLADAGFVDTRVRHSYGYYSLIEATKPASQLN
jgi:acetylserotonin N-methyltransferase